MQAVWLGHATVLVQLGGLTLLTDPILSERCSPLQFLGPRCVSPRRLRLLKSAACAARAGVSAWHWMIPVQN